MNISRIFIERPIATSVLFVSILFFGWLGFNGLPVNDLPNVDFPTISVTARLPGASPEVMGNTVALPLDDVDFFAAERYRYRGAGCANGYFSGYSSFAVRHAGTADSAQIESSGCAGVDSCGVIWRSSADVKVGRIRGFQYRTAILYD